MLTVSAGKPAVTPTGFMGRSGRSWDKERMAFPWAAQEPAPQNGISAWDLGIWCSFLALSCPKAPENAEAKHRMKEPSCFQSMSDAAALLLMFSIKK